VGIPLGELVSKGPMGIVGTSSARHDTSSEDDNDPRKPVSLAVHKDVTGY